MPGRHDSHARGRDGWAPTAVHAVAACTPATSLFAALGLAGGGYLAGREDVAACGAAVGAFGMVVERLQTRGLRRRLRRERARFRDDLRGVSRELADVHRALAGLREDLDAVRSERDSVREQLHATLRELTDTHRGPVPVPAPWTTTSASPAGPVATAPEPLEADGPVPAASAVDTGSVPARAPLVPGQLRSPIATGGIPLLPPGPSEPVRVVDLRSVPSGPRTGPVTRPIPRPATGPVTRPIDLPGARADVDSAVVGLAVRPVPRSAPPAATVDEMVFAALDDEEADELTRVLTAGGRAPGRHAGVLHAGDAHHAGDYARGDDPTPSSVLFVVNHGRHVA